MFTLHFDNPEMPDHAITHARLGIGMHKANDLIIKATGINDFHALILVDAGRVSIVDLDSGSGTKVNGKIIRYRCDLQAGDEIMLADTLIKLEPLDPASPSAHSQARLTNAVETKVDEHDDTTQSLSLDAVKKPVSLKKQFLSCELVDRHGQHFPLNNSVMTLGRSKKNSLMFDEKSISQFQAVIILGREGWILTDRDSLNGTRINGQRISSSRLHVGDKIHLGRFKLYFRQLENSA